MTDFRNPHVVGSAENDYLTSLTRFLSRVPTNERRTYHIKCGYCGMSWQPGDPIGDSAPCYVCDKPSCVHCSTVPIDVPFHYDCLGKL